MIQLAERVNQYREKGLLRSRRLLTTHRGVKTSTKGIEKLIFCHNDYLGLAQHPKLIAALQKGAEKYGVGGVASQMVAGHLLLHAEVEAAFAEFLQRERALLFSSGYLANLGVVSAVMHRGDEIFADKMIHASLIDAAQLSRAKLKRYPHLDYLQLEQQLARSQAKHRLIMTDSVFSMRGDIADVKILSDLAAKYQADLMIDDAHGIGVLGQKGRGIVEHFNLSQQQLPILVCPLAKAFAVMGGIVAGSNELIEALLQFSRSYMYTSAMPPALAYTALISLQLVQRETWRRDQLNARIVYFKQCAQRYGIDLLPSDTPIQMIPVGDEVQAQTLSQALFAKGIVLNAMRQPTVPIGQASLRVSLSCLHQEKHIDYLFQCLRECYE